MLNRNSAITGKYNIGKYPFDDKIEIILFEKYPTIIAIIAAKIFGSFISTNVP